VDDERVPERDLITLLKIERVENRFAAVDDDLPRQVISHDVPGSFGVYRTSSLPTKIDGEFLEHLGAHDAVPIAPQLLDERLRSFVLWSR
jgi:hypothetical protein